MAHEHVPRWLAGLALVAVFAVPFALGGVLVSLVTLNQLLVGSAWQVAAVVTVAVVAVTLAVVALTGGPISSWERTPYW
jgi:hypothetical protein